MQAEEEKKIFLISRLWQTSSVFKLIVSELCISAASCTPVRNVTCATHVRCELVNLVEATVYDSATGVVVPQVINGDGLGSVTPCSARSFHQTS